MSDVPADPRVVVCEGNEGAAIGVALARPDVVAVYPITPQSSLVEHLSQMIADGRLKADLMNLEGEHSVMSALQGAALAGARTFTATCGPGLAFMFEPYIRAPGMRLPMVCALVTRDVMSPQTVWGGQQDAMIVRDAGWIQMYCETGQEVLDTVIMAYKIAEHRDVVLPVNVCCDGNYLGYGVTRIEVPEQAEVDAFLPPPDVNWHVALDPARPMSVDPLTGGAGGVGPRTFVRYRKGQCRAMQNALRVIEDVHEEWFERFGRWHAPLVEEYRLSNAKYALVTIGSMSGAAKDAVDAARSRGEPVGLIKLKTLRPFPLDAMLRALAQVQAIGVVDRAVAYGWNCGPVFQETLGALYHLRRPMPAISCIGGLSGADITERHFAHAIALTERALAGELPDGPVWLNEND
ncbi:MAG TPA: phenylglyoxylate dehydrogenase [Acetobacteraceae bacterium]|nr:phenylglyoxylate dehydrogenase [Acetobacteraceae bacterium]